MRPAVEGKDKKSCGRRGHLREREKRQRAIEEKGKEIGETAGHSRERRHAENQPCLPPTKKAPAQGAFRSVFIAFTKILLAILFTGMTMYSQQKSYSPWQRKIFMKMMFF